MSTNPGLAPVRRALISVSDKTGIVELAKDLAAMDVALVSTGRHGQGPARGRA